MQEKNENPLEMARQYWSMVRHYGWWVFLGTVLLSAVFFTVIAKLPDYYRATTTILVDPQRVPERYVSPVVSVDPAQRLSTISQEVLSTTRLQEVIDTFHLYDSSNGRTSRDENIERLKKDITIEVKQGPISAFTISYMGRDPVLVAQVTNQLAASFIKWNLDSREQQTQGTTDFLTDQLKQAKQNLEEQEQKFSQFKLRHMGEMPDQQQANLQVLSQLQSQYQANSEALSRLDVQRMITVRSGSVSAGAPPQTERGRLEAEKRQLEDRLADLRRRYTADYPDVVDAAQRLERVKAQIRALPADPESAAAQKSGAGDDIQLVVIEKERKRLEDAQRRIEAQIQSYKAKIEAAPIREQEMAEVTRNYQTSKALYQSLLDKTYSAEMAKDLERKQQGERFIILDPARVPQRPYKPKRAMMMLASLIGSLGACLGLVIAKEMADPSLKTEADLKKLLPANVPVLACVPAIETADEHRRRVAFAAVAIGIAVLTCLLEAGFYWKLHPFL